MSVGELKRLVSQLPDNSEIIGPNGERVEFSVSSLDVSPAHYTVHVELHDKPIWPHIVSKETK